MRRNGYQHQLDQSQNREKQELHPSGHIRRGNEQRRYTRKPPVVMTSTSQIYNADLSTEL
jgi:hypothetical protein